MESKLGFFNVDCYERTKCDLDFDLRPRVRPIGEQLDRLYTLAKEKEIRTVFTTCCDGKMLKPKERDDILFVPVDSDKTEWLKDLNDKRIIYLDKLAWGTAKEDIKHVAWDMFLHNKNATRLFKELDIPQWIVFGNGIDLCVSSAAKGILNAGFGVTLIEDVMISSANGTPESMEQTIVDLCALGAKRISLEAFLAKFQ